MINTILQNKKEDNNSKFITKTLEWRSNTIFLYKNGNDNKSLRKILLGTDTSLKESNYVNLLSYDKGQEGDNKSSSTMNIIRKYKHNGNIIRVIGVDESKCITASSDNNLYLYNLQQKANEVSTKPDLTLNEHDSKCTNIDLDSTHTALLSSSEDGKVCLWNITSSGSLGILKPINILSKHNNQHVNDVNWCRCNDNIFASGGNDNNIIFYDKRSINQSTTIATTSAVVKVNFNYLNPNLFISANGKYLTDFWDLRNTKVKLHSFKYHKKNITAIKWSNTNENLFASASHDNLLVFWDVKLLEEYASPVKSEDNPFEAVFIYNNKDRISDFDWKDGLIALVDMGNNITAIKQEDLNIEVI